MKPTSTTRHFHHQPLQPPAQAQSGVGRMPHSPQAIMHQQQQLLLQQQAMQQQRMLQQQQQNSGLNAAIRELQQKTQQNQRQSFNPQNVSNHFKHPLPIRPQQASNHLPNFRPDLAANNSQSPCLIRPPQMQAQIPRSSVALNPAILNQNICGGSNNFLGRLSNNISPAGQVLHQPNASNLSRNPLPAGSHSLSSFDSVNNNNPAMNSPLTSSSGTRVYSAGKGNHRDGVFTTRNRSPDTASNHRSDSLYSGHEREWYNSQNDLRRERSKESRGRSCNEERLSSRDERRHSSSRYDSDNRDKAPRRSQSLHTDMRPNSDQMRRNRDISTDRQSSDRSDKRFHRSEYRDEVRQPNRNDKRSDSNRRDKSPKVYSGDRGSKGYLDDRHSKSYSNDRGSMGYNDDRNSKGYKDDRSSKGYSSDRSSKGYSSDRSSKTYRDDRSSQSRSDSRNRSHHSRSRQREKDHSNFLSERDSLAKGLEEDFMGGGLSQYRQDLMKSEWERKNGSDLNSDFEFSRKRFLNDLSDEEKWDKDMKLEDEEFDSTVDYPTRSCPADMYFSRNFSNDNMEASKKMIDLEKRFAEDIIKRAERVRAMMPESDVPSIPSPSQYHLAHNHHHHHHSQFHKCGQDGYSSCESSSEEEGEANDDEDDDEGSSNHVMDEWERKRKHPLCLHSELWYNESGRVNDGPLCRCSLKSRKSGIRHDIYPGEETIPLCDFTSNNLDRLHHYRVTMSPYTNFLTKTPTLIEYDNHEYVFEGFSLFTHTPLDNVPSCKLVRFNIEYTIHFIPETPPENFTVGSLNLFSDYLFSEVLELLDLDWGVKDGGCRRFHFMPRFCRSLPDSGCKEVLSMNTVLNFLMKSSKPLVDEARAKQMMDCHDSSWRSGVGAVRGMIVTKPGMKPSSIRIDQLDRNIPCDPSKLEEGKSSKLTKTDELLYPLIIHQGFRPAQLSYAGDPLYRRAWKQYVKFRHLLNSKPKIDPKDKQRLKELREKLQDICIKKSMKREVTIELNSKGFLCTGLRADLCQHALMVPVMMSYLRFHICLSMLEEKLNYQFKDRTLLQLALTHTSYRTNYGTNPDHTRNSLTNCGMRQVEYGDRRVHYQNTRKRGICILLDIMSRFGKQEETISEIPHNERLEFLGDAVIEFLASVHLFFMFPWLEEGGLSTYRMALVQNQHLAQLARKLRLEDFMLYVHGPDLCHESDLQHAMANCCEALMGALFLDGGLEVADSIFSKMLFDEDDVLLQTWTDVPKHILQQSEPGGDRHWIKSAPVLQKLENFEESIGVKFSHIRLLAKAFTHRNIGDNPLTMGHNQRLEFLGDTVLQLVASEYLYRHYPEHHEGHLSLLRSSLVNSRTQAMVYDDVGMSQYVILNESALTDGLDMKTKQRADMLEAFIGALYVDKGLDYCWAFCNVCFFPRLKDFIMNQDWNDPKSQLQQCCLTLREVGGGEPDIPIYKMIESIGPTNTRKYVVAVYFRGTRLATGSGHTIQQSEMAAATLALKKRAELFPILQHQRRFVEKMKHGFFGGLESANGGESTGGTRNSSPRKRRRGNHKDKKNCR